METATLIRDRTTGRWLGVGLTWTDDRAEAVAFSDAGAARRFVGLHACEPGPVELIERQQPAAA